MGNVINKIPYFYHGVSTTLFFDSTEIKLCGPVSTTASFHVATDIFGAGGLVLSIKNNRLNASFFDCVPWSDFVDEDEKLFIGGWQSFTFHTIRNLSTSVPQNYGIYVQVIVLFQSILRGDGIDDKPTKKHCDALQLLIEEELEPKLSPNVSRYVLNLWHHFLQTIDCLELDWMWFRTEGKSVGDYPY